MERARIEGAQERKRECQRESQRRRRENANTCVRVTTEEGSTSEAETYIADGVNQRLVRRDVATILGCIQKTLRGRRRLLPHK